MMTKTLNNRLCSLVPLLAILFLAGCSTVSMRSDDQVGTSAKRSSGFMGLATADDVSTTYAKAFAGVDKVVIGGFKVGFNDSKRLEETTKGIFSPATTSTALVKLEGIDSALQQAITDQIYDRFVKSLEAHNYEVVSLSQFTQSAAYQRLSLSEFPFKLDQSGLFSSYGVGHYYSPTALGSKQPFFPGENDGAFFAGMSGNSGIDAADKFSQDTNIRVLGVTLMLDFAGATGGGSLSTTGIDVGQLMVVDSGQLVISRADKGIRTAQVGMLKLGQPVASEKTFATIENVTSDTDVALEAASNAVSGLLRGGILGAFSQQANQTREFIFTANPSAYEAAALEALEKADTLLLDRMAALRNPE